MGRKIQVDFVQTVHHKGMAIDIYWDTYSRSYGGHNRFGKSLDESNRHPRYYGFKSVADVVAHHWGREIAAEVGC